MAASTDTQKAFFKSLADFARSTANVLDEMAGEVAAAAAPAKPTKAKEKPAETAKVETAKVETAKVETAKVETKPANGGDLMAQCRSAAKSYAEVYGREGLKEQIQKFTTGTLADVPAEKLPELLKVLG